MFRVGRVCVKTAGREAGAKCVVIEETDDNFVKVDGLVTRKRCNRKHLEPLGVKIDISEGAGRKAVLNSLLEEDLITEEDKDRFLESKGSELEREPEEEETQESEVESEEETEEETESEEGETEEEKQEKEETEKESEDQERDSEEKSDVLEELEDFEGKMEELEENIKGDLEQMEELEEE